MRIGIGYDLHRTAPDRVLRLGGVQIEAEFGLLGHSDADVLLHAITDALLGAAGLGDIGDFFPDTDERWHDADSRIFVENARDRVIQAGYRVANVDTIIHAQQPHLGAHKPQIRASVADLLRIPLASVAIKATTNEKLGEIGRSEAIAAWAAIALVAIES